MVKWIRPQGTVTDLMSHSRFHLYWKYVLRRAWLSLWNKHMLPTGSIGYHKLCLDVSGGIFFSTNIHTMHRVLFRTPTTWVCVHSYVHVCNMMMYTFGTLMRCTLVLRLSHDEGANSLHMVLFSSLVRLLFVFCCYRVYQYSSSESLIFSFHSLYMYLLSMDQRPETRTFGRLLHQPYFTAAFLYYWVSYSATGIRGTYSRCFGWVMIQKRPPQLSQYDVWVHVWNINSSGMPCLQE